MRTINLKSKWIRTSTNGAAILALAALVVAAVAVGCASTTKTTKAAGGGGASASAATTRPATSDAQDTRAARESGAQLWAENCMRCHNLRSPETYSSAQWEVAVHHMRLRANLTGEETRKITAFLKSAN